MTDTSTRQARRDVLGDSALRPDGVSKTQGSFAFSGDLSADGFLWGATLRSPHPSARIRSIDVSGAWAISGVEVVITADDVPGKATYGLISAAPVRAAISVPIASRDSRARSYRRTSAPSANCRRQ